MFRFHINFEGCNETGYDFEAFYQKAHQLSLADKRFQQKNIHSLETYKAFQRNTTTQPWVVFKSPLWIPEEF